ncbi:MAG: patatin-like phospholipase family protein [bacterium]|nr:patatin-like phospholipase family protein [bacterium]
MSTGPTIGLALGSGGARGLAHAGVLQALEETGIRPDFVAGTSMGSIVGGLYAQDPSPDRVWQRLLAYVENPEFASYWTPFVPRDEQEGREPGNRLSGVFDFMQRKLIAVKTVTRPYQLDADRLRGPLTNLFGPVDFADLEIPFAAVALDLIAGEKVIFDTGPVVEGVYASSAIPGIFPSLEAGGRVMCDGGGPFRVPVDACREQGADLVIAVDIPAFEDTHLGTGMDMILRSNTVARQRLNDFVLAGADFVIRPDVTDYHWADFANGAVARERGYLAGKAAVGELRDLLRWRNSLAYRARRATRRLLRLETD